MAVMMQRSTIQSSRLFTLFRRHKGRFSSGWEATVKLWIGGVAIVLFFNISLTAYASTHYPVTDGIGTLYEGNCQRVSRLDTYLHLLINVFSSLILGASNYTMQVLASPTRNDIDIAHKNGEWLDIGIPSVRNLWKVKKGRRLLWWLLALSSIPMHFLFNSASFQVITSNQYNIYLVDQAFLHGAPFNRDILDGYLLIGAPDILKVQKEASSWQPLNNQECIQAYSNTITSTRSNLVLISSQVNQSTSLHNVGAWNQGANALEWHCVLSYKYEGCGQERMHNNASFWQVYNEPVESCLSQRQEQKCMLQYSQTIMVVIILCNLLKLACLACTIVQCKDRSLCTLGDALDSFLTKPDTTTENHPLLSKEDLRHGAWKPSSQSPVQCAKVYVPKQRRWFSASSITRWIYCIVLISAALITSVFLYFDAAQGNRLPALWNLGFGKIDPSTTLSWSTASSTSSSTWLLSMVLLANLPQVILSFLYLMYNGIWTCMLAEYEWTRFAFFRKGLRVSKPRGEQRASFYLELPLRYGLPLVGVSSLLHWLVSQSLFFVRIMVYNADGTHSESGNITSCGYSPIAIFFTILAGCVMLLGMIVMGFRKYPIGMPLAGSCSAVISAACHPPVQPKTPSVSWDSLKEGIEGKGARTEEKVMWGWVDGDQFPDDDPCSDDAMEYTENPLHDTRTSFMEKVPLPPVAPANGAKRGRFTFSTGHVEQFDQDPSKRKIVTSRVDSFKIEGRWKKVKDGKLDSPV